MSTSRRMLKDVRRAWLAAFTFSAFINLLLLATPLYTLHVFESAVPQSSKEILLAITFAMLLAISALFLLEIARDVILLRASTWLEQSLGRHILENGLKRATAPSQMQRSARALDQLQSFLISPAANAVMDAPFAPVFLAALAIVNPILGGIGLACALALGLIGVCQILFTTRLYAEGMQARDMARKWWRTVATHSELAGGFGLTEGASRQCQRQSSACSAALYSHGKRTSVLRAAGRSVRIGLQVAIYGAGAWLVMRAELAPAALVASAILLSRGLAPLEALAGNIKAVASAVSAYRELKTLPEDARPATLDHRDGPGEGSLSLNDVTVYQPGRKLPALRSVSLELAPGHALGIVGANGSGKTTLAAVLAGAVVPAAGSVSLEGIAISKWQRDTPHPPVGFLADEPLLLEGTVHENIARFADMSMVAVARAAMRAGVHETLMNLPSGYDTPVLALGANLSMRERRAVAFARALAGNPRFVVLDEPERGLDGASLKQLVRVLEALKADGLGLAIATQDPRLLAFTDCIAVLSQGTLQSLAPSRDFLQRSRPHLVTTTPVQVAGG